MPPWEVAEEVRADDSSGSRFTKSISDFQHRVHHFVKMTWVAEHTGYEKPADNKAYFADTMVKGPFWKWNHDHYLDRRRWGYDSS